MTKAELLSLPTNKATVKKIRQAANFYENASLYSTIIDIVNNYLSLPKVVKAITDKPTVEGVYSSIMELKEQGYRQEVKELN